MFETFYQYLVTHKKVVLPGFGTFNIVRKSAQLNFAPKIFTAPIWQIAFVKGEVTAEKHFYAFVSKKQNIDEVEAIRKVNDFIFDIKREFSVYKKLEWPKIGSLLENSLGEYQLHCDNFLHQYFPDTPAERVVRESGDNAVFADAAVHLAGPSFVPNDELLSKAANRHEWWIDAIILTLVGVAAVAYYYFQTGGFR